MEKEPYMNTLLTSDTTMLERQALFSTQSTQSKSMPPRGMVLFLACVVGLFLTSPAAAVAQGICNRTPQVRDKLVEITSVSECGEVTAEHLAGVTGRINLSRTGIGTLRAGDFDGLSSLAQLILDGNQLTSLPEDIFSGLSSLELLFLSGNQLTTLPTSIFSGLTSLKGIALADNQLISLPTSIFSGLTSLEGIFLRNNPLTSLPAEVFSGLTSLELLILDGNQLTALPADIFSGLTSLERLYFGGDQLTSLPEDIFSGLSSLEQLYLRGNQLTSLPEDIFSGLSSLRNISLYNTQLTSLPEDIFSGLSSLEELYLRGNQLTSLPEDIFSGLGSLEWLSLVDNQLTTFAKRHLQRPQFPEMAQIGGQSADHFAGRSFRRGDRYPRRSYYLVSARKPLYRSFPVTIHHTFRASCSPISSRKMSAMGLGGVIGGGPAPIFGTRP